MHTETFAESSAAADRRTGEVLRRSTASEWATWFDALGDATRVQILHLLATTTGPLTVGEITDRLQVGQSTVSHHLSRLAAVGFVLVTRVGTASHWRVNVACLRSFPSVAEVVMGRTDPNFLDPMEDCHGC